MTRLAILLLLLLLTGCASEPQFIYKSDMELYGVQEKWTYPMEKDGFLYGDCEDYAIWIIENAGRGVVVVVETGEEIKHAVALVDNDVYDINYAHTRKLEDYEVIGFRFWNNAD